MKKLVRKFPSLADGVKVAWENERVDPISPFGNDLGPNPLRLSAAIFLHPSCTGVNNYTCVRTYVRTSIYGGENSSDNMGKKFTMQLMELFSQTFFFRLKMPAVESISVSK